MVTSTASTIEEYLDELSDDKRASIERVREVVLEHLPEGYEEVMNWGMICYQVPLETFSTTYNGEPLMFAALAAQKNHNALYLMNLYQDKELGKWLEKKFDEAGKELDMGKSCIRFTEPDDLALDVIGEAIANTPPEEMIELYKAGRREQ